MGQMCLFVSSLLSRKLDLNNEPEDIYTHLSTVINETKAMQLQYNIPLPVSLDLADMIVM